MDVKLFCILLIPFLGTVLGSACVFFMKNGMSDRLQRSLSGFAAGVMTAASVWSLLIPALEQAENMGKWSFVPAAVGFWAGILFLLLLDRIIPHLHINEDKADNRAANLEWMTNAEQNRHGTRTLRAVQNTDWHSRTKKMDYKTIASKHDYGAQNMCNRKRCVVEKAGVVMGVYGTLKDAAKAVGANYSKASDVANGRRKMSGGYTFRYI